jgi:hypothetical protein
MTRLIWLWSSILYSDGRILRGVASPMNSESDSVMRHTGKIPKDSAANHYYIHDLEASEHPEQALHRSRVASHSIG